MDDIESLNIAYQNLLQSYMKTFLDAHKGQGIVQSNQNDLLNAIAEFLLQPLVLKSFAFIDESSERTEK